MVKKASELYNELIWSLLFGKHTIDEYQSSQTHSPYKQKHHTCMPLQIDEPP